MILNLSNDKVFNFSTEFPTKKHSKINVKKSFQQILEFSTIATTPLFSILKKKKSTKKFFFKQQKVFNKLSKAYQHVFNKKIKLKPFNFIYINKLTVHNNNNI
jgi:hypothetical protein